MSFYFHHLPPVTQLSTINSQLSAINRSRVPDARTTTLNRSTINYQLSTLNRSRVPDARTTTIDYQLSTLN
ncbi:MAG: hypothetical protein ACRC62_02375 [Microcoleus sp.]